ncbi:STAS-like domain-containing protein [Leclercia adecarboxylata]|uniref:STAS-like domain-containing protein n=1 Tax=Leclercia adecarboxylata TaxID=83655 RepID=UPI00195083BB|nr:STAS-like domain-containing protein [Leclercia adecarboxylata]MBM6636646.1 STAS-like domain-containing protein [Leclercia adecarboxylata]
MIISVANDYSKTPFGRYNGDSPFSAERFREEVLIPAFTNNPNEQIIVDFSGVIVGLGSSFLEEVFGGLVRSNKVSISDINERLVIKSKLPIYEGRIRYFIEQAATARN